MSDWLLLAGSLAGVIIGALLTAILQRRQESTRWLRDRRLQTYSEMYRAYIAFRRADSELKRRERMETIDRAMSEIGLIGSDEVMDSAGLLFEACFEVTKGRHEVTHEERQLALSNFLGNARVELGLKTGPFANGRLNHKHLHYVRKFSRVYGRSGLHSSQNPTNKSEDDC